MGAIEKLWYAYIQTEEYQLDEEYNYQIPNDVAKELEGLVGRKKLSESGRHGNGTCL